MATRFNQRAGSVAALLLLCVVAGSASAGLTSSGRVVAWGDNTDGQTNVPPALTNVSMVVAGVSHSAALRVNGTVAVWGDNTSGQTNVPAGLSNVVFLGSGWNHLLAVRSNGSVVAWGNNGNGQTNVPAGLSNIVAVAGGWKHSLALRSNGTVLGWGNSGSGQTNVPVGLSNVIAISAGRSHSLALRSDGRVVGWGDNTYGQTNVPSILTNAVAIDAGANFSAALRADGTLVAWGYNGVGQTNMPVGVTNAVAVNAGTDHGLAVRSDGRIAPWGDNASGQTNVPAGLSNVVAVSAGSAHSIAIMGDILHPAIAVDTVGLGFTGIVHTAIASKSLIISNAGEGMLNYSIVPDQFWIRVDNPTGQLAVGQSTSCVVQIAARGLDARTYAGRLAIIDPQATNSPFRVPVSLTMVQSNTFTTVVAWGRNLEGQINVPANINNAVDVSGGAFHSLALMADGTLRAWGYNFHGQTNMPAVASNSIAVSAGGVHSLAVLQNQTVVSWGDNTYGQTNVPANVTNIVDVAAGYYHSLALRSDGSLIAWGDNSSGQTNIPNDLLPTVAIAAGYLHTLALAADGTVRVWGDNGYGQTNIPAGLTNVVAVSAGRYHSLALQEDGQVVAWGGNNFGESSVPVAATNALSLGAGFEHSVALLSNGNVVAWGRNIFDQSTVPAGLTNVLSLAAGWNHTLALALAWPLVINSEHGFPSPGEGTNGILRDTTVSNQMTSPSIIDGGTQLVCAGWIGTGSTPSSGTSNSVSFVVTNESSLTWLWSTNYWLAISASGGGIVTASNGWHAAGTSVVVDAVVTTTGAIFRGWTGETNGCLMSNQQIAIPMDSARDIQAVFTGPGLDVQPMALTVTGAVYAALAGESLTISNAGETLEYSVQSDVFWLSAGGTGGTLTAGQSTTLVVQVSSRGLAGRTYWGSITISSSSITNSPIRIPVSFTPGSGGSPGAAIAWGDNSSGQTNVPLTLIPIRAIAAGDNHSLALRMDGRVAGWGYNFSGQTNSPSGLTNVVAIAAGYNHSLALKANGSVVAWGNNTYGQTNVPVDLTNVVDVAGGFYHSLVLRANGSVAAWGNNGSGQTNVPTDLTNAVAVASGSSHCLGLRSNGRIVGWGYNFYGQTNIPSGLTNAVAIAAGYNHSMALTDTGTVVAWGYNAHGQTNVPAGLANVMAIACGRYHSMALRTDGTVAVWGNDSLGQTNVPSGIGNLRAIAGGGYHSLAMLPAYALTVDSYYGSPTPGLGTNWAMYGTLQNCSVLPTTVTMGGTQAVAIGWLGSGSVPTNGVGTSLAFLINEDSSLSWQWGTNFWLQTVAAEGGFVTPTSDWFYAGSDVVVLAQPSNYWHFVSWTGGVVVASNPVTINLSGPMSVTGLFGQNLVSNQVPELWLAAHGWSSNFEEAAAGDWDGDSMLTWEEYVAGVNPTNSDSYFGVISITNQAPVVINVLSSTGRIYSLESRTNLSSSTWQGVTGQTNLTGNGGVLSLTGADVSSGLYYYRVRVALP